MCVIKQVLRHTKNKIQEAESSNLWVNLGSQKVSEIFFFGTMKKNLLQYLLPLLGKKAGVKRRSIAPWGRAQIERQKSYPN